ncbi:hypothetical protein [Microbacterium sp.]|uniref:hypothetical protein n=1 Tax=Microbacterium sp. TaxID=51671 RepID=UPI003F956562
MSRSAVGAARAPARIGPQHESKVSPEVQGQRIHPLCRVLDGADVEAITALGRADGRLFNADPRVHEES